MCYTFFEDVRGVKEQPITIRLGLRTSKALSIDLPSEQEDVKRCTSRRVGIRHIDTEYPLKFVLEVLYPRVR